MKNIFIALLFIANISYANNELVGKWVMIDECSFLSEGEMNTKYCQSQLGINRESYEIFYEDGTYDYYYKNLDWERGLFNIDYPDFREGTYTIEDNILKYSDKVLGGDWHVTIDNNLLTLYNAKSNKMVHYKKETLYASR
tara:strand:+ start:303 stop:722 length:420 start_codon:yes stop_codon:yes gene_type:complete